GGRDRGLASLDGNAPARGDRLQHRAVDPGPGFLKLGDDVQNAPVADEALADGVLKLIPEEILHTFTPRRCRHAGCGRLSDGGRSESTGLDAVAIIDRKSTRLNSSHVKISYA